MMKILDCKMCAKMNFFLLAKAFDLQSTVLLILLTDSKKMLFVNSLLLHFFTSTIKINACVHDDFRKPFWMHFKDQLLSMNLHLYQQHNLFSKLVVHYHPEK